MKRTRGRVNDGWLFCIFEGRVWGEEQRGTGRSGGGGRGAGTGLWVRGGSVIRRSRGRVAAELASPLLFVCLFVGADWSCQWPVSQGRDGRSRWKQNKQTALASKERREEKKTERKRCLTASAEARAGPPQERPDNGAAVPLPRVRGGERDRPGARNAAALRTSPELELTDPLMHPRMRRTGTDHQGHSNAPLAIYPGALWGPWVSAGGWGVQTLGFRAAALRNGCLRSSLWSGLTLHTHTTDAHGRHTRPLPQRPKINSASARGGGP